MGVLQGRWEMFRLNRFFFFKQKTAYELLRSLVGSEMCIRDRVYTRESDQLFKSEALIKFLSGLGKLKDDFDIRYATPAAVDKDGNYLLRLYPREKGVSYQYCLLYTSPSPRDS